MCKELIRELQILCDTINSIEVFCSSGQAEFAVQESLKAIGHVEFLKTRPDIYTDTETLLNIAEENNQLRHLLSIVVDKDSCRYDHHGLCQSHCLHPKPCPHEKIKSILAE